MPGWSGLCRLGTKYVFAILVLEYCFECLVSLAVWTEPYLHSLSNMVTFYRFCEESQKQKHAMLNMARQVWEEFNLLTIIEYWLLQELPCMLGNFGASYYKFSLCTELSEQYTARCSCYHMFQNAVFSTIQPTSAPAPELLRVFWCRCH